jgi:hypothetical protein
LGGSNGRAVTCFGGLRPDIYVSTALLVLYIHMREGECQKLEG